MKNPRPQDYLPRAAKASGLAMLIPMSLVPIGVGTTVLWFMWIGSDNGFGAPPVFFKVFASFIALGFIGFGLVPLLAMRALRGGVGDLSDTLRGLSENQSNSGRAKNYICPHCSAPLEDPAAVPPSGDVQCSFCHGWFNINRT